MKTILSKILLFIAVGLLFSHQFVTHHHHAQDSDFVSQPGHDHDDQDHDANLPDHNVAHVFLLNSTSIDWNKISVSCLAIELSEATYLLPFNITYIKREYSDIRPPLISRYCNTYFSLRAPPSLS